MLVIYERAHQQTLQVETRFDREAGEYVLIIRGTDGTEQVERFVDPTAFRSRLAALEHRLEQEHWQNRSSVALPDAWIL